MLLTRECDYGVRIIRSLGSSDGKKTVQEICKQECIPEKFAYKILKKLRDAGLIESLRGSSGGYRLIKPLNSFTVYDIIAAVDDRMFLNECLKEDKPCSRNTKDVPCTIRYELMGLKDLVIKALQSKNMEEMLYDFYQSDFKMQLIEQ